MFTRFWDMCSGGGLKEDPYQYIYIEAPEGEAKIIFYNRFGHSPERVSCTCCGDDYSIDSNPSLELSTAFHRGCIWDDKLKNYDINSGTQSLEEYLKREDVLFIPASDIKPEERIGSVPEQGYVWRD